MNRITKRTWLLGVFLAVLLVGVGLFTADYFLHAGDWVSAKGSPHVYNGGNLGSGTIYDRNGIMLLNMGKTRTYADLEATRHSTLHWLGDRKGSIQASAITNYALEMSGFDPVNGVFLAGEKSPEMTLTISAQIQNAALEAMDGRKGTIGIYNYRTGEILCALTTPTYDPDNPPSQENIDSPEYEGVYLNRFLQSVYIPGSIFKVVTTAAALETVPDILDKTFNCTGSVTYGTEKVTCEYAHGRNNLSGALAHSCNCAFAQIAELVGRENMEEYVAKFLVTQPVSFDGVTTVAGNYDISDAGFTSFAWSCIGQYTDQINPCRYMTFMGSIAAGGQGVTPHLVRSVTAGDDAVYTADANQEERIMDEATAQTLREYLRGNVWDVYGDGNFYGLNVCAKSGTSQLGGGQKSNAMFAGFVADEDYPLAFVVVVENGGYGRHTCVPVIAKVLRVCKTVMDGE